MKWEGISLLSCTSANDYLAKTIEFNLDRNPNLSIRWLGRKLEWPPSYINDVLARRKTLTLQRTLELAKFLELDVFETEHLVLLTLSASGGTLVQDHFKRELYTRFKNSDEPEVETPPSLGSISALLVFGLLGWAQVRLSNHDIKQSLYTLMDLKEEEVEQIVAALQADGLITIHDDHTVTLDRTRFELIMSRMQEKDLVKIALQMLENLANYVRHPHRQSPGPFHFRIQTFPLNYIEQVEQRLAQFSNWISDLDVDPKKPDDADRPKQLFQFMFFFAPMVDKEVMLPAARKLELGAEG